jgi:hypothetical protein
MTQAWFRYERQNSRWCPVVYYGDQPKVPNGEEDRFSASHAVAEGHLASDGSPMFGRLQAAFPAPGEGNA